MITQVTYSCILFTIKRYAQEESVRDVHHGAAHQTEDINESQAVQVVQVSLCGGDANIHRLLQIWACQSWQHEMVLWFSLDKYLLFKNHIWIADFVLKFMKEFQFYL